MKTKTLYSLSGKLPKKRMWIEKAMCPSLSAALYMIGRTCEHEKERFRITEYALYDDLFYKQKRQYSEYETKRMLKESLE